ncbi:hypothetical protein ASE80_01650 [Pseudomonas sp. Leaf15]|uniref:hypothetical protein n=1 Tax=unclassified Pseudomonas TaxID=196821 RepID=UPI0007034A99|nr:MULTISPECIES: hypothetical protein [unclassified Pseudomonas]KQM55785.1 hypothetical protein ASE80_01650 [Pseudomonas sp. Leaf15]RAH03838.1 hypothetical protein DJ480_05160 [Pseudomonas sp. Leaf98]
MSNPSKSTDHRDQRDRYTTPTSYEAAVWGNGGNLQFSTEASMGAQATDSSVLAQVITQAMDEFFNGGEWHDNAADAIPCEFRPKGTEPTPVQLVNMVNRNLEFDPRQSIYDTSTIAKGEAVAGDFIFTEPTNTAAFFSHRFTLLDAHVVAGFTGNGMEQMMDKMLADFEKACGSTVVDILIKSPSTEAKEVTIAGTTPRDRAEDWIDALTMSINQSVGNSLSDFVLLMHMTEQAMLERAAQRAGVESIEGLLGCRTQFYSGSDRGVFMLPKGFASLSFRHDQEGDVWKIHASRNAGVQGWDFEVSGIADVMAQAKVRIKLANPEDPTEKLQVETVDFPLITRVVVKP